MVQVYNTPIAREFKNDGSVGAGYQLFFYITGTTTKKTVYADEALTTPLTNPVVADANGRFVQIFMDGTGEDYKVVLGTDTETDPPTSPIWTADPVDSFDLDANSFDPRPAQHWGTTAGTAAAYTITAPDGLSAYADDILFSVQAHITNTASPTINVSSLGAINLIKEDNAVSTFALEAGDMQAGGTYNIRVDNSSARVLNPGIVENLKTNDVTINEKLNTPLTVNTISSGAIVYLTNTVSIAGESGVADSLTDITGGVAGDRIRIYNAQAYNITIVHNASKIDLIRDVDAVMVAGDTLDLICIGSNIWIQTAEAIESLQHPICKAWVQFNGTNGAITDSYNVSGVVRNGAGNYTVSFTNNMPDANYAVVSGGSEVGGHLTLWYENQAVGSFDIENSLTGHFVPEDTDFTSVAIFSTF